MSQPTSIINRAASAAARIAPRIGLLTLLAATALGVVLISTSSPAQSAASQASPRSFFRSIIGEWVGTCEQSTDGKQADNKYFHAVVRQIDDSTFDSQFEYFRLDKKTGSPLRIGNSTVTTTVAADGTARNKITGKGIVLVNNEPKNQTHSLLEVLSCASAGSMQGQGSGTIKVGGMPLGLGKNGKVQSATSAWSISNGILNICQTLKIGFRALVFKKKFDVIARYTARRGSDVVSLMTGKTQISARP